MNHLIVVKYPLLYKSLSVLQAVTLIVISWIICLLVSTLWAILEPNQSISCLLWKHDKFSVTTAIMVFIVTFIMPVIALALLFLLNKNILVTIKISSQNAGQGSHLINSVRSNTMMRMLMEVGTSICFMVLVLIQIVIQDMSQLIIDISLNITMLLYTCTGPIFLMKLNINKIIKQRQKTRTLPGS